MRDPFGPLHQGEELFVCCLADIGYGVVGLQKESVRSKNTKTTQPDLVRCGNDIYTFINTLQQVQLQLFSVLLTSNFLL